MTVDRVKAVHIEILCLCRAHPLQIQVVSDILSKWMYNSYFNSAVQPSLEHQDWNHVESTNQKQSNPDCSEIYMAKF